MKPEDLRRRWRVTLALILGFLAEALNKFFPLIVLNIAQTRLGIERFGHAQFGLTLVDMVTPLVVFGYGTLAVLEIAAGQKGTPGSREPRSLSAAASRVVILRFIHALIAFTLLATLVQLVPSYQAYRSLVLALSFTFLTAALDVTFAFTATQRLATLSTITILAKGMSLFLITIFVRGPDDTVAFAVLTSLANSLVSLAGLAIFLAQGVKFTRPTMADLKTTARRALPLGILPFTFFLLDRGDILVAERTLEGDVFGYYAGVWRIEQSLLPILFLVANILFSEMAGGHSREQEQNQVRLTLRLLALACVPISCGIWFVDEDVVRLILNFASEPQQNLLATMVLGFGLQGLIIVFGLNHLLFKGEAKSIAVILIGSALVGIGAGATLASPFGAIGIAVGSLVGKGLAAFFIIYKARRHVDDWRLGELGRIAIPALAMVAVLRWAAPDAWLARIAVGAIVFVGVLAAAWPEILRRAWLPLGRSGTSQD